MDAKRNAFWIACGAMALLAAVFWGVAVASGKNAEIARAKRDLDKRVQDLERYAKIPEAEAADPAEGLPVAPIVEYWEKRKKALDEELAEILKRYRARDKRFEEVLGGKPIVADFVTLQRRAILDLKEKYKAHLDDPAQVDKVFPIDEIKEGEESKIPIAQKQLECMTLLAEAAKEADPGAKLVSTEFPSVEAAKDQKELQKVRCEAAVKLPFPAVPKLVSRLLKGSSNVQGVVFELAGLRAETAAFALDEYAPYGLFVRNPAQPNAPQGAGMKNFTEEVYVATRDETNPKTPKDAPDLPEPPVIVRLSLAALDFELPEDAPERGKK